MTYIYSFSLATTICIAVVCLILGLFIGSAVTADIMMHGANAAIL